MSPKNLRVTLLGACVVALALVAMPLSIAPDTDDALDVAERAKVVKQGKEVQVAKAGGIAANGRAEMVLAKAGTIAGNGRLHWST